MHYWQLSDPFHWSRASWCFSWAGQPLKLPLFRGILNPSNTHESAFQTASQLVLPFLSRLFDRVYLKKPVSNVRSYVRTSVCPSTKVFFDFNEIWHVARCPWVVHDDMQYDPNPRSRSRALQSWKSGHFLKLSFSPFTMATGNWPPIIKLGHNI